MPRITKAAKGQIVCRQLMKNYKLKKNQRGKAVMCGIKDVGSNSQDQIHNQGPVVQSIVSLTSS